MLFHHASTEPVLDPALRVWRVLLRVGRVALTGCCLWVSLFGSASALAGPRVAVFGLHAREVAQPTVQRVQDGLQAALKQSSFQLMPVEVLQTLLLGQQAQVREQLFLLPGRVALQEARTLAEQAQFADAVEKLLEAERSLLFYAEHLTSNQELIEIQVSLAQLYSALGDQANVEARLTRLVELAPERALDPLRASPALLETYARIREQVLRQVGSLELLSEPAGAKVYVDGVLRGATPQVVEGLPLGKHFVRLEHESGRMLYREVTLTATGRMQVGGRLGAPSFYSVSRPLPAPSEGERRLYEAYRTLGRVVGADLLLLGQVKADGLEVQLLNVVDGQRSALYEVPLALDLSNLGSSMRNLALQLEPLVGVSGSLLKTSTYPLVSDPASNQQLSGLLFESKAVEPQPAPVSRSETKGGRSWKPLVAVAAGVVGAGVVAGVTAAVLAGQSGTPGSGVVIIEFP
ncbi:MAG: PEGA domain-containing protein [Myxococcota bacterium]